VTQGLALACAAALRLLIQHIRDQFGISDIIGSVIGASQRIKQAVYIGDFSVENGRIIARRVQSKQSTILNFEINVMRRLGQIILHAERREAHRLEVFV